MESATGYQVSVALGLLVVASMAYYNDLDQHVCGYKRDAMCVDVSVAISVYVY